METFDGLAILATNLRANIDEAFTRRLDVVVDFPLPDAAHRGCLWDRCLGAALSATTESTSTFCARAFELAGGAIRSAAVTAAYLAADDGGPVTMEAPRHRRAAGVPQAGQADAGERVRPLLGDGGRVPPGRGT